MIAAIIEVTWSDRRFHIDCGFPWGMECKRLVTFEELIRRVNARLEAMATHTLRDGSQMKGDGRQELIALSEA